MKSIEEVIDYVIRDINAIYRHPKLFAADAGGVEVALDCYYRVWANATDRRLDFESVIREIRDEERCSPYCFDRHYKLRLSADDDPSDDAAIAYVISQYRKVGERLGIVLPQGHEGHT